MICTALFVTDIMNPEVPRTEIFFTSPPCRRIEVLVRGIMAFFPVRNRKTQTAETNLRQNGGKSRALDSHIQAEDKDRVQDQIQDGADGDGQHTGHAKALGIDEVIHSQADHDKDRTQKIDG